MLLRNPESWRNSSLRWISGGPAVRWCKKSLCVGASYQDSGGCLLLASAEEFT